jgi:enoyl-CoA hydratase
MTYNHISVVSEQRIATITFNRPKSLNALNSALLEELSQALDAVAADEQIHVLVLTGAGGKAFRGRRRHHRTGRLDVLKAKVFIHRGLSVINKLTELPIPVIAAVNGFALGGGLEIAMACDFIYASENASFRTAGDQAGSHPGYGGTQRLPRIIGAVRPKSCFHRKNDLRTRSAALGIVNQVLAPEALMDRSWPLPGIWPSNGRVAAAGDQAGRQFRLNVGSCHRTCGSRPMRSPSAWPVRMPRRAPPHFWKNAADIFGQIDGITLQA